MDSRTTQRAILLTVSYASQFSYPLTAREIWTRLISPKKTSFETIEQELVSLVRNGLLVLKHQHYYLHSYSLNPDLRVERKDTAFEKLIEVEDEFLNLATSIPWILAIGVTGSVAVDNAKPDDDVDFLIITKKNTLWLTRLCIIFIALLKKKRRSWGKEEKNSWCFNLWLDETALKMPSRLQTAYGAHEVCQTKWIYIKDALIVQYFYKLNVWAKKYIYNFYTLVDQSVSANKERSESAIKSSSVITTLNNIAYILQRIYMVPHITKEKVSLGFAFFHPRDTKGLIYTKWREIIKNV